MSTKQHQPDFAAPIGLEYDRKRQSWVRRAWHQLSFFFAVELPKKPIVVYLVGCGKAKRSETSKAKELYTGALFRAARAHAEKHSTTWRILSARHHVVSPERRLQPYDTRAPRTRAAREDWSARMATQLENEFVGRLPHELEIVCLAGADYVAGICERFSRRGFKVSTPLAGLGLGKRLQWFKQQEQQ